MKIFLVFCLVIALSPFSAMASSPASGVPSDGKISFDIFRSGKKLGTHSVAFNQEADTTRVKIKINMAYQLGPVTLFRYAHTNTEIWRHNKPVSLKSETNDDGTPHFVEAAWQASTLKVKTDTQSFDTPSSVLATSYWNKDMLRAKKLLNSQTGELMPIRTEYKGRATMAIAGQTRDVDSYILNKKGEDPIEVWYDTQTREWVGLKFTARGAKIEYRRTDPIS
ncbi:MAG: hypothetical protein J0L77_04520 [Alphaproteobacteria bacterium]|nr:hypothetical protein [Alphaproteobacteria bacterium]